MKAAQLFEYLETNFSKNNLIQFRLEDIEHFEENELVALTKLFEMYQPGMSTSKKFPAVIAIEEKEKVIEYLSELLN